MSKLFYSLREWENGKIFYILLTDCHIYTKVQAEEMFAKHMDCGCFIDFNWFRTQESLEGQLEYDKAKYNARFVEPDEFIRIEKGGEADRVRKAFAVAEQMIREG